MPTPHRPQFQNQILKETKYNRKAFEAYLSLYPVSSIRLNAGILVFFYLNLFLLIPVFSVPYIPLYAWILLPPLLIMNIWALALMIAPGKLQLNYLLFRGVFGIVCSVGFMIVIQKFAYTGLRLTTPCYAVGSFAVYGLILYQYARLHIRKLVAPRKKNQGDSDLSMKVLTGMMGFGYLLANLSLMFVSKNTISIVLICVYAMLALVMFHFIMELHRYYWMKREAE